MNIIPPEHFGKPEPSRPVMALASGRQNPGTVDRAAAEHYLILSLHWPDFLVPAIGAVGADAFPPAPLHAVPAP